MRDTVREINDVQEALEKINNERKRLGGNKKSYNKNTIKIAHYSDVPLMCDLTGLGAYDDLHLALLEILDKREDFFKSELGRLAHQLVEETE